MGAAAIPDEFVCPISGDVMRDPVWLSTGVAVDRAFGEWYLQAGFTKCPVSGETIKDTRLVPVPNMAEYIAKWGRRVGFDLDVTPTEDAKTHAIIQALERVEQTGTSMQNNSLPRATPAEIEEAWDAYLRKTGAPAAAAIGGAERSRGQIQDGRLADGGALKGAASGELSLMIKGYAAANAVPAPDEQDGSSPASSQENEHFPDDGHEGTTGGHALADSRRVGFMGKIFSNSKSGGLQPSATPSSHPIDKAADSTRQGPAAAQVVGGATSVAAAVAAAKLDPHTHGRDNPQRMASGSDTSLPSSCRMSLDSIPQDETPTHEASRAAAAWSTPPAARPEAATAVTRSQRSAASYAKYSNDDSRAFTDRLADAEQRRLDDLPSPSSSEANVSPPQTEPSSSGESASQPPAPAFPSANGLHDHTTTATPSHAVTMPSRTTSSNPLSVRGTSGARRNSYVNYNTNGGIHRDPMPMGDEKAIAHVGPAGGGEITSTGTSASGSLMEEVIARNESRRQTQSDDRDREQQQQAKLRLDDGPKHTHALPSSLLMAANGSDISAASSRSDSSREGSSTSQRGINNVAPPRSLPLAASLRPAVSPSKPIPDSVKTSSFGNSAAAGADVQLPSYHDRDLSFDDGTRGPVPPQQDSTQPRIRLAPYTGTPYGAGLDQNYGSSAPQDTPSQAQQQSSAVAQPAATTPAVKLTAGGMPMPSNTVGGRVRRLSRRLSGTFNALIGRKLSQEVQGANAPIGPEQVVARRTVPSDSAKAATNGNGAVMRAGAAAAAIGGSAAVVGAAASGVNAERYGSGGGGSSYMGNYGSTAQTQPPQQDAASHLDQSDSRLQGYQGEGGAGNAADRADSLSPADLAAAASRAEAQTGGGLERRPAGNASPDSPTDHSATQGGRNQSADDAHDVYAARRDSPQAGSDFEHRRPSRFNEQLDAMTAQHQPPSLEEQQYQQQQLLQQQADVAAAAAAVKEKPSRGLFGRRLGRRNSKLTPSLVALGSFGARDQSQEELVARSPMPRSPSAASHQRMADQAEVVAIVNKMRDARDPRVGTLVPVLERLADLTDDNDEMRSYFIATGGATRLAQLAESPNATLKAAAARVVWHLARNPVVAMELMRTGVVPALYTVFKTDMQDPLPFIGALVHFNCHAQDLAPFTPDQIRRFIDALLIAGSSAEDALAASFSLSRLYEASKSAGNEVLKLLAGAGGAVQALVAMLGLPFCSGSEAAARLLGALAQNVSGMAARIAHHGGVQGLAQLLDCPVPSGRTAAAQALAKVVAAAPAARQLVEMDDVTSPLFDMLRSGDASAAEASAWLVGYCATDPTSRRHLTSCGVASALMPALAGEVGGGAREGAAWAADQISQEAGGVEPFAAAGACPALLGLVKTGQHLGRDSALRLLAAIGRSGETDGVTLVGTQGLKVILPLLTVRPDQNNRASRVAAMEVVRVMCTQHGIPRKANIDLAVREGAVKAIVAIARSGSTAGRDAAAASLAELSASGSKTAMQTLRKEKAPSALIPIMISGSVGGREAAAVALANLSAGSKDTAAEIVKAHGLVGLNQLLLSGTPSGKAAGAALVTRLAPSPAFQKAEARGPLMTSLAAAVGLPSAATRIAAAEALSAMGESNAANKQVVARAVPALLQMLRTPDLSQVETAALALSTMAKSPHMLASERIEAREVAGSLRAAGVVTGLTVSALDAIVAACRTAGPGRATRGASYADYGATGAPSGYTTAARRTSYADYGSGQPGSANGYGNSPFSNAPSFDRTGRNASAYTPQNANAKGGPPWAQAASYDSPDDQGSEYKDYNPSAPGSQRCVAF